MKIKSRRFSKTVANDFGTVSLGTSSSPARPLARSLSLSLNEQRSNRVCAAVLRQPVHLVARKKKKLFYHFVINHVVWAKEKWLCVINEKSCTQCMTGRLLTLSSPDFLCRFLLKHWTVFANLALAPTFRGIENLLRAFFLTALMSSRCHFSVQVNYSPLIIATRCVCFLFQGSRLSVWLPTDYSSSHSLCIT